MKGGSPFVQPPFGRASKGSGFAEGAWGLSRLLIDK